MSCSTEWMPALSKVKSQSYTWRIEDFRDQKFTQKQDKVYGVGLCSSTFKMSLNRRIEDKNKPTDLCLWLTRDFLKNKNAQITHLLSQWLRLSVSTKDAYMPQVTKRDLISNRYMCTAWISGRCKERACMLTVDSSSSQSLFTDHEFVLYNDLLDNDKGLLCTDSLTIVCELHTLTDEISYVDSWLFGPLQPVVAHRTEHALASDLKRMLDTGQDSNVTLVANDGREFPAHVLILSSRSPVFAAMFRHDMKEQLEKRVTIDDVNSQAVKGLLDFIYTDTVPRVSLSLAEQLLYAAHKYNIPRLKTFCEDVMAAGLNAENAAEFLSAAHLYEATQLHGAAKHFTVRHIREVKQTQGWKTLQSRSPHLAEEIMDELADLVHQLMSPE